MSEAHFQAHEEEDVTAYAIALGSPYHFESPASEDDERTPRLADDKEWQLRRCQVLTDCSDQKPPWICVAKCLDEDTLPIPELTLSIYSNMKRHTDWKDRQTGKGDHITVYFWRLKLEGGKKGGWNFFWDKRVKYQNIPD